jgi:hypothetical protein
VTGQSLSTLLPWLEVSSLLTGRSLLHCRESRTIYFGHDFFPEPETFMELITSPVQHLSSLIFENLVFGSAKYRILYKIKEDFHDVLTVITIFQGLFLRGGIL